MNDIKRAHGEEITKLGEEIAKLKAHSSSLVDLHSGEIINLAFRLLGYDPESGLSRKDYLTFIKRNLANTFAFLSELYPGLIEDDLRQMLRVLRCSPENSYIKRRNMIAHCVTAEGALVCARNVPELSRWVTVLTEGARDGESLYEAVDRQMQNMASHHFLVRCERHNMFTGRTLGGAALLQAFLQACQQADDSTIEQTRERLLNTMG